MLNSALYVFQDPFTGKYHVWRKVSPPFDLINDATVNMAQMAIGSASPSQLDQQSESELIQHSGDDLH